MISMYFTFYINLMLSVHNIIIFLIYICTVLVEYSICLQMFLFFWYILIFCFDAVILSISLRGINKVHLIVIFLSQELLVTRPTEYYSYQWSSTNVKHLLAFASQIWKLITWFAFFSFISLGLDCWLPTYVELPMPTRRKWNKTNTPQM